MTTSTTTPAAPSTTAAMPVAATALPLRQQDPVSWGLAFNVILTTAVLLALTYGALRWYAKRKPLDRAGKALPPLQCAAALRLSARTKLYLVTTPGGQVLVTESATGVHSVVLTEASPSPGAPAVMAAPTDEDGR